MSGIFKLGMLTVSFSFSALHNTDMGAYRVYPFGRCGGKIVKDSDYTLEEVSFHHVVLEGSHYEIGEQLAEYIKGDEDRVSRYTAHRVNPRKLGFDNFQSLRMYYEDVCPGISEELQGVADGLGLSIDMMPYWETSLSSPQMSTCSQVSVLSAITEDEHSYLGRNYDYDTTRDDRVLCTTRAKGKASHIGFTAFLYGRHDGMNEHGLIASLTGTGVFGVPLKKRGVVVWVAIRSILDSCRDVNEALALLERIPVGDFDSLMLLDRSNNVALVEYADGVSSVKMADFNDQEGYLYSVNHYRLAPMREFNKMNVGIIGHSRLRGEAIESTIEPLMPKVTKEDIKCLLSTCHPKGLCNHYYDDGFGTLWSVIYDSTSIRAEACFGAPSHNAYREYDLKDSVGIERSLAIAPVSHNRIPL
jgi:predicted choloylglycine hydrolase